MSTRDERVASNVKNFCQRLIREQLSHAEFLNLRGQLLDSEDYVKIPTVRKEFWRGYVYAFTDSLYIRELEWAHVGLDGVYYPSEQFRAKYGESCYSLPWFNSNLSRHVWKGTQKAY